jgi:hypothetical protein
MTPTIDEVIHELLGIRIDAPDLTPMDKGECKKVAGAYAASLNRQGWTRVEDGLPESVWNDTEQEYYKIFSKQVNVFLDNGYVTTCAYNRETKKWFTGGLTKETGYREVAEGVNVTHWMKLPEPPK